MSMASLGDDRSRVVVCEDAPAACRRAAQIFVDTVHQALQARGRFFVALSGGSTPKGLYELLATPGWRDQVDWAGVHVFWSDERFVPPSSPQANYGMADAALLSKVSIPRANIVRVPTEAPTPEAAAEAYEQAIRAAFSVLGGGFLRFDLVLLGLGSDGHTASLFPHSKILREKRLVASDYVAEAEGFRVSMTPQLLNQARAVMFLVIGAEKAPVLREVLYGSFDPERLPAQLIKPEAGEVVWVVDRAAAALLPESLAQEDGSVRQGR